MKAIKAKSLFLAKYTKRMFKIFKKIYPYLKEEDIEEVIHSMVVKNVQNPEVYVDNNYTHESKDSSLLSIFDWAIDAKPIICGNGTFYKQHKVGLSPTSRLQDSFLVKRDQIKAEMFAIEDNTSPLYRQKDLKQVNVKKLVNSYYGGSGMKQSAFYSEYSGPATTGTAQAVISTAEQTFEGFAGDNYLFIDLTEAMEWCETILKYHNKNKDTIDSFIEPVEVDDVVKRINSKIIRKQKNDEEILFKYLASLSDTDLVLLYYKNNLIEFIKRHEEIRHLIFDIFYNIENLQYAESDDDLLDIIPDDYIDDFKNKSYKDWNKFVNKSYFMDPNNAPESIKYELEKLSEYMMKYIYAKYLSFDRIYRLKNFPREIVTVIDTDSNILSFDTLALFILQDVLDNNDFGRDYKNNVFIVTNLIANLLSDVIEDALDNYGLHSNIDDEHRGRYRMKNEFMFDKLIIAKTKKRYLSKIVLREGNLMNPPKYDIKGFDFRKSTTSEFVEERFIKMIKKNLLNVDEINLEGLLKNLNKFKKEIIESIKNGEIDYLTNGNAKEIVAYKNPESEQSIRGVLAWNILNPDNMIELPSKVKLLKLNIFVPEDIYDLRKTDEEKYHLIYDKIFHDKTNMFVNLTWVPGTYDKSGNLKYGANDKWYNDIPKEYRVEYKDQNPNIWNHFVEQTFGKTSTGDGYWKMKSRGMQVIAIPTTESIPEWLQPYIDIDTVVNNILSPMNSVLDIFNTKTVEVGKTINSVNRKSEAFTNVIKF